MAHLSWSIDLDETASIGNIARKVMSYGTTQRNVDNNEMYLTHPIQPTDTLQGIALKYGVTMEHLRRVNRLWASDSMHLRKLLLIPMTTKPLSPLASPPDSAPAPAPAPPPLIRNANFPAGTRENPLSRSEAMALLRSYENDRDLKDQRPGTPESSSSSDVSLPLPVANGNGSAEKALSPSDFFSRMDQSIASCRLNTQQTVDAWGTRSFAVEEGQASPSGGSGKNGIMSRSPSWGRVVRARKPHPDLQLEGVDNMVFEL